MVTGALLIPVLLLMIMNLESLRELYMNDIRGLYKSLGLTSSAMAARVSPFQSGSFANTLGFGYTLVRFPWAWQDLSNPAPIFADPGHVIRPRGGSLLLAVFVVIVPSAAQIGTGYKVSELLDRGNKQELGYKISELFDKAPLGWFSEALAYLGQGMGEAITFTFALAKLPRQGSDWVSDLFVILAFFTALVLFVPTFHAIVDAQASRQKKHLWNIIIGFLRITFYFVLCVPLVWIGCWLGYFVAAS